MDENYIPWNWIGYTSTNTICKIFEKRRNQIFNGYFVKFYKDVRGIIEAYLLATWDSRQGKNFDPPFEDKLFHPVLTSDQDHSI